MSANDFRIDNSTIGDVSFVGGAIGYTWNNWLRFDGSAEYRSKARVDAFGHYTVACTELGA